MARNIEKFINRLIGNPQATAELRAVEALFSLHEFGNLNPNPLEILKRSNELHEWQKPMQIGAMQKALDGLQDKGVIKRQIVGQREKDGTTTLKYVYASA